jgi:hypothetical protein
MSLQLLAKQMEAKGRKGDSMLVHMTPGEVEGLQKLAEAAGGTLTINPETGLVEANFLKKLISSPAFAPLAGFGLAMIPGVGPMMAAGLVGGGTALATGDVGKGAMAGLGAFGGAGLAGGLSGLGSTALTPEAIATANASADPIASLVTAKNAATSAGVVPATGFKAIASGAQQAMANPSALVNQMGGLGGLAKAAGMAAAPMLTQEQKMADAPVDDEMYYTEYNPGQTGERSSTSTEVRQFAGGYAPMERIKAEDYMKRRNRQYSAAQGGLMSLAEGGETAAPSEAAAPALSMPGGIGEPTMQVIVYGPDGTMYPNPAAARAAGVTNYTMQQPVTEANRIIPRMPDSGATSTAPSSSEAALAYLMGERSSSAPARSPFIDAQLMGASPKSNIGVGGDNMYAFDPATGTFLRNPNVAGATSSAVRGPVGTSFSGGDSYQPAGPNPDFDTPEKQAAFYRDPANSVFANITRGAQTAFGFLPGGSALLAAQEYMDPGAKQRNEDILSGVYGLSPADRDYFTNNYTVSDFDIAAAQASDDAANAAAQATGDYGSLSDFGVDVGGGGGGSGEYSPTSDDASYGGFFAQGGIASLAKGGMASGGFVVPADVVSALGNGSTDAGLRKLHAMTGNIKPIKGKGDGLSDSIPTDIDGKQAARVADGEAYIDPKTVKRLGGAKKLYAMMDKIRAQAHGKTTQQRKVNPARVMA